jgi:hypothetical protein
LLRLKSFVSFIQCLSHSRVCDSILYGFFFFFYSHSKLFEDSSHTHLLHLPYSTQCSLFIIYLFNKLSWVTQFWMQSELDIVLVLLELPDYWGKQTNTEKITIQLVSLSTSLKWMSVLCHVPSGCPGDSREQNKPVLCFLGTCIPILRQTK